MGQCMDESKIFICENEELERFVFDGIKAPYFAGGVDSNSWCLTAVQRIFLHIKWRSVAVLMAGTPGWRRRGEGGEALLEILKTQLLTEFYHAFYT